MAKHLTRKQELFCLEYCKDFDGLRAAISAGYSEKSAASQASQLLNLPKIQEEIRKRGQKALTKVEISVEKVLKELSLMGFSNMLDYMTINDDGQADIDLSKLSREQAAAIQEVTVDTTGGSGDGERRKVLRTKLKLAPKTPALELMGKYLKMFVDKVEVTGDSALLDRLAAGRKRVAAR